MIAACAPPRPDYPVIGAKNFTEQVVLGELLAQHIEAVTGLKVERRFYLAGSYICNQALIAGRIDAYVEYTGTALTAILKQPVDKDPQRVLETVGASTAANNVVVTVRWVREYLRHGDPGSRTHRSSSHHAEPGGAFQSAVEAGVGYEFEQRPDGLPGLQSAYGLKFDGSPGSWIWDCSTGR